ncbi:transmembrane protein 60 isoform X1 [Mustela lutreola]|uniref:transmembrane protein 60 isoform X1 n=1 Tax=Mustela lutreola TaxID=9666 RepID=UPI0027976BC6|nr:transmembrane protein 60 isoform X1 [Mustela lutreola]
MNPQLRTLKPAPTQARSYVVRLFHVSPSLPFLPPGSFWSLPVSSRAESRISLMLSQRRKFLCGIQSFLLKGNSYWTGENFLQTQNFRITSKLEINVCLKVWSAGTMSTCKPEGYTLGMEPDVGLELTTPRWKPEMGPRVMKLNQMRTQTPQK